MAYMNQSESNATLGRECFKVDKKNKRKFRVFLVHALRTGLICEICLMFLADLTGFLNYVNLIYTFILC